MTARPGIAMGNRRRKYWLLMGACLVQLFRSALYAQAVEFLPEINTYVKLDTNVRFAFQAKETRENGFPKQAEIGPSMEFYWRPLKNLRPNEVDEAKTRFMLLSFWIPLPALLGDACHPTHPVDGHNSASFEVKAGHFRS